MLQTLLLFRIMWNLPNGCVLSVCLYVGYVSCTDGSWSNGEEEGLSWRHGLPLSNTWHVSIQLWTLETFIAYVLIIRWLQLWHQLHMVSVQQPNDLKSFDRLILLCFLSDITGLVKCLSAGCDLMHVALLDMKADSLLATLT